MLILIGLLAMSSFSHGEDTPIANTPEGVQQPQAQFQGYPVNPSVQQLTMNSGPPMTQIQGFYPYPMNPQLPQGAPTQFYPGFVQQSTTVPVVQPLPDLSTLDANSIRAQVNGGELPPIQVVSAIFQASEKLGSSMPKEFGDLKEHLLDRFINHNKLLMKALESREDVIIRSITKKVHDMKSEPAKSDNPFSGLPDGTAVPEHEKVKLGLFARMKGWFHRRKPETVTIPPVHEEPETPEPEPMPESEEFRPIHAGDPNTLRRRMITRVILKKRDPPFSSDGIEGDMEEDERDDDIHHSELDRNIENERHLYDRHRRPGDRTDVREAVPDPREETQFGYKQSKLYRKPLPYLDFDSRIIGYPGDNVFHTGLDAGRGGSSRPRRKMLKARSDAGRYDSRER